MTIVADASVVVEALILARPEADWASRILSGQALVAPHLMPVEVANALRRGVQAGRLSGDAAALALAEAQDLPVDLAPFAPFATRVWELRDSVTPYDAWYVALAEFIDAPLVTLDLRLASAPGPRCRFLVPDAA